MSIIKKTDNLESLYFGDITDPKEYEEGDIPIFGMEVGDNRISCSPYRRVVTMEHIVQEDVYRMVTSIPDTYVSADHFDIAETLTIIPRDPLESIGYAKKHGTKNLGFIDTVALRVIVTAEANDKIHSSTNSGKSDWIGSRMLSPREELKWLIHLASFFQDGILGTHRNKSPKYLPRRMGGSNCPPLFGHFENTYLYLLAYKNGSYSRVYGSAINELRDSVSRMDSGEPAKAPLCDLLSKKGDYLHCTFANMILLQKFEENLPMALYKSMGNSAEVAGFESRMLSTKRLITKSQALVEQDRAERITRALFSVDGVKNFELDIRIKEREIRENFKFARSANAAVQRLLAREGNRQDAEILMKEFGYEVNMNGVPELTFEDVKWLVKYKGQGEIFSYEDIPVAEDMYIRAEISREETLRVKGIKLLPEFNYKPRKYVETKAKIGLWRISEDMEEWADNRILELSQERERLGAPLVKEQVMRIIREKPEWVRDDGLIVLKLREIAKFSPISTNVIVTADSRLCYTASRLTGLNIVQLDPIECILRLKPPELSVDNCAEVLYPIIDTVNKTIINYCPKAEHLLVDTASVEAFASRLTNLNKDGKENGIIYHTQLVYAYHLDNGERVSVKRTREQKHPGRMTFVLYSTNDTFPRKILEEVESDRSKPPIARRVVNSAVRLAKKGRRTAADLWKRG